MSDGVTITIAILAWGLFAAAVWTLLVALVFITIGWRVRTGLSPVAPLPSLPRKKDPPTPPVKPKPQEQI